MSKLIVSLVFSMFTFFGYAAQVDTLSVYSASMKKNIKTVVILPDDYAQQDSLPVVYLLHGYGGNYKNWVDKAPAVKELADVFSMIIVCPDGGKDSWYWDSAEDPTYRYETFFTEELIPWVDKQYKSRKSRAGRAITGLSMGGQGALYLSFRHQDLFGAAGSTAGGVDIRPFPNKWNMARHLGRLATYPQRWNEHSIVEMVYLLTPGSLALMIDCGVEDFFYPVNEALHKKLLFRNIPHHYMTGPGKHNWDYWRSSISYQLLFMHRFFEKSAAEG